MSKHDERRDGTGEYRDWASVEGVRQLQTPTSNCSLFIEFPVVKGFPRCRSKKNVTWFRVIESPRHKPCHCGLFSIVFVIRMLTKVILSKHLAHASHNAKGLTYIVSFNPHKSPEIGVIMMLTLQISNQP